MIKKIAAAIPLVMALAACDDIPKCDAKRSLELARNFFYEWETKRVRPIGGKEPTEEDLRFDFFGGQRMLKVERDRHKTTKPQDMQIYDVVEVDADKDARLCSAKARSTNQSRVATIEYANKRDGKGSFDMYFIKVW